MLVRFETRLLAAFTAAVICTVLLSAITWRVGVEATQVTNSVSHTHEVLHQLARTRSDTIQIELSTQTFRISGNEALLLERDATAVAREKRLAQLEEATRDSPRQQERLGQLREVLAQRQDISRRVEVLRKTQGESAAAAFVASAPLQETRQRTYAILGEMDAD